MPATRPLKREDLKAGDIIKIGYGFHKVVAVKGSFIKLEGEDIFRNSNKVEFHVSEFPEELRKLTRFTKSEKPCYEIRSGDYVRKVGDKIYYEVESAGLFDEKTVQLILNSSGVYGPVSESNIFPKEELFEVLS